MAMIKTLTNAQLKEILRTEGLPVSGVKYTLQIRIIHYLEVLTETGQSDRFDKTRRFIYSVAHPTAPVLPQSQAYTTPQSLPPQDKSPALGLPIPSHPFASGRLNFKDNPFHSILQQLTPTSECKVREHTRDNVELRVVFTQDLATKLQEDPNLRVMVYCAADNGINQFSKSDISFPHQVELKVNLEEIKGNLLKGLKNRPGTTRPVDVTNYMRKKAGYSNQIIMTYALTQKKFYLVANLVKRHPVEELVAELKARKTISKEQVLREMRNRASDSDIVATSSVVSLKCPLSQVRIVDPCRSTVCTHNRCFDATSFLQLQEQAPTWSCPICSKSTSFASLQIDQYFDDILRSTSLDVEQVTIEPDGTWFSPQEVATETVEGALPATGSENGDLIEIQELGVLSVKRETLPVIEALPRTPGEGRKASATSSIGRLSSRKRSANVIDLTLSDDENATMQPAKRPAVNGLIPRQGYHGPGGGVSNGSSHYESQPASESPSQFSGYDAWSTWS